MLYQSAFASLVVLIVRDFCLVLIAVIVRVDVRLFVCLDVCVCTPVQVCGLVSYMNRPVGRLWLLLAILDWISQSPSVLGFGGLCQGCYKKGVSRGGVAVDERA